MKLVITFGICLFSFSLTKAQDLAAHKWEHRLILIYSESEFNPQYLRQIQEFNMGGGSLTAHKLKVYHFLKEGYVSGLENKDLKSYTNNFFTSVEEKHPFTIQLIGLDGGVKLTSKTPVLLESLKTLIDGMPMRRFELDKN